MSNDKDKLLEILASLESDYAHGKISKEKYIYFRSKYEDRLNAIDAKEATNRIRSMQGKPSNSPKVHKKPVKDKDEEDLVQKYIINPKKGDGNLKEKTPMDSGTFKLVAILILALGFTVGAGFGVFNFDFKSFTPTDAGAMVTDTAFPDVADVHVNTTATTNTTSNYNQTSVSQVETTTDTAPTTQDSVPQTSDGGATPAPAPAPESGGGGSESTPTQNTG